MYRVLIVDDEPFILDGLKYVISWEEHGLEIISTAKNGIEALEILENTRIDILITDIKMPKMDGLELIRSIKHKSINTKIIILSGYNEFEYAREAARLGIENYILKPVEEEELSSTLLATVDKIEAELNNAIEHKKGLEIIRENILYRWVSGTISDSELKQRFEMADINPGYSFYLACILSIRTPTEERENTGIEPGSVNVTNTDVSLMQFAVRNICEEVLQTSSSKSTVFSSLNGDIIIVFSWDGGEFDGQKAISLLTDCIDNIKTYLKLNAQAFAGSVEKDYRAVSKSYSNAALLMAQNKSIASDAVVHFESSAAGTLEAENKRTQSDCFSPLIKKVIHYIDTWYYKEISLKTLSVTFNVNPAYLGRIFKKETGEMFTNYLNKVRIESAKLMLVNTELKANEIAEKIGYTSPNYFYYIFKKLTGEFPTDYKKNHYTSYQ